ncbi:helicase associated domain-containing protein [Streptomyces sp. NPDC002659]|uniref:helicase associated domain-containing protein n=1 Tax=Streptomyces sp. NPDC002659 TaxID=3364656 RepID=UPI003696BE8D
MTPAERPAPTPVAKGGAKAPQKAAAAFQRAFRPSRNNIAREGHHRVPRAQAEAIAVEGETTPVIVKLGVWVSNAKSRRDKLTTEQRAALAELGVEWA